MRRFRDLADTWHFWMVISYLAGFSVMCLAIYTLNVQTRQAEESRTDLCYAVNGTRALFRQILILSRDQAVAQGFPAKTAEEFYAPMVKLAGPVDCAEVVPG